MKLKTLCTLLIAFAFVICTMTACETVRASTKPVIEKSKSAVVTPCVNPTILAEVRNLPDIAKIRDHGLMARTLSINTNYAPVKLVERTIVRKRPEIVRRA